ncbi:cyclohexanecarboxylate-CoA ligase [Sulfitobacter alexandrii]|uniref:Cyclohexanecarboxylate-CoA ligase n=1 Tax=Sulfitobacter alexandrii TaxID=1917485 RepID=A0A1J0WMP1_9RHOB|nr:cyclohexanecarboxylate-CoA ligase [Sulfitobacter alexandrii]
MKENLTSVEPSADRIARFREAGIWRNRTIADDIREIASASPDKVLWVEGDTRLTAGAALKQAEALASNLHDMGLRAGDVVSFQLPNWTETVVLDIACVLLGLVVNPVVPIYRNAELALILADCEAKALFIPEKFRSIDYAGMVADLRPDLPALEHVVVVRGTPRDGMLSFDALLEPAGNDVAWPEQRPEAAKMILYTSGTTGRPKGVLHSHETVARALLACFDHWGLAPDDWTLMPSPVTHVTGFSYGIEWPLTQRTRTVFMDQWDADRAVGIIDTYGVASTIGATPFLAELVGAAERAGSRLPSLRIFGCGGAAVPPGLIRKANKTFANTCAFRVYGSTEVPVVTLGYMGDRNAELASDTDGEVVDYEVKLVDDAGHSVSEGEGEVLARGPAQFLGYLRPEDREGAFSADGYFLTGDIGRRVDHAGLLITGRKKDLIIRGGENLSAKEIEDAMHQHDAVTEAAVVSMPHDRLGETVCAYVIPAGDARPDVPAFAAFLGELGLARQKCPERVEYVDDLPRTASGKVRKDILRKRISQQVAGPGS